MKKIFHILLLLALILTACKEETAEEKKLNALKAAVLNNFAQPEDSLCRRAAEFLLQNLQNQYTSTGSGYAAYTDTINKYTAQTSDAPATKSTNVDTLEQRLRKMRGRSQPQFVSDINTISAAYLTANIRLAVETWQQSPWKKQIDFRDFCEYILPYRIGKEELSDWRKEIHDNLNDSLYQFNNIEDAGEFMVKKISAQTKSIKIVFGENSLGLPDLHWAVLKKLPIGSCKEQCEMGVMGLRAGGIPCAIDYTPLYANYNSGHLWNALIIDSLTSIPFGLPWDTLRHFKEESQHLSKVFRKTWSVNPQSHFIQRGYCSFLPASFNNPFQTDVTAQYVQTATASFDLPGQNHTEQQFAYLCTFDYVNWTPVAWGKIENNRFLAHNIATNIVYLPVTIDSTGRNYLNAPFLFCKENNKCVFFRANRNSLITVNLLRKYPLTERIEIFINRMKGGDFQAANKADFSDAITLHHIEESPGANFNDIAVATSKKFRYFRYRGGVESFGNIGEIEVYGNNDTLQAIKGIVIGTEGSYGNNKNCTKEAVFDGDPTSYFDAPFPDASWVGLDFGKPLTIERFRFIARSDFNIIVKGNVYELMYWDNGWQSAGTQTASSEVLTYKNIPSGALYLLHNHTEGKEERIFAIENGKQIWW